MDPISPLLADEDATDRRPRPATDPVDRPPGSPGPPAVDAGEAVDSGRDAEPLTFEQLYRREYEPMLRVAFLLVGSESTAEEVVQDAFVRVHGRFARLERPGGFLRTCVVNACRDRLRRRGRFATRMPLLEAAAAQQGSGATDHADLYHSLLRLPHRQRAALVLRFYEGWSDNDIAQTIGVRPGTVKSLVHRGLAALRKEITP